MEDFGQIFWGIAFVLYLIGSIASVRKKAQQAKKRPQQGGEAPDMPRPIEWPPVEYDRPVGIPRPAAAETAPVVAEAVPASLSEQYAATQSHRASAPAPKPAKKPLTAPAPATTATDDDPIKDFDLRKAVIWSEILHPKFEE